MRVLVALSCVLALGACAQTAQVTQPSQMALASPSSSPAAATAATEPAQPVAQNLPPIYEPLVDMYRVNQAKYAQDLAACREEAAPQERAARAAAEREAAGTAVQTFGIIASVLPVGTWQAQRVVDAASGTAQVVGATAAAEGAATGANAAADYALVVNACLEHRGYRLLRA